MTTYKYITTDAWGCNRHKHTSMKDARNTGESWIFRTPKRGGKYEYWEQGVKGYRRSTAEEYRRSTAEASING